MFFSYSRVYSATAKPPWPEFNNNLAALFHVATLKDPPTFPPHLSLNCSELLSKYVSS